MLADLIREFCKEKRYKDKYKVREKYTKKLPDGAAIMTIGIVVKPGCNIFDELTGYLEEKGFDDQFLELKGAAIDELDADAIMYFPAIKDYRPLMTDEEKAAERSQLFELFINGKATVAQLFDYFKEFIEKHPGNTHDDSPFHAPGGLKLPVIIQKKKIDVQFTSLDKMIEYFPYYDEDIKNYRMLRWNNANDNVSTYKRNVGSELYDDAVDFQKNIDISHSTLTAATRIIFKRLKEKGYANANDEELWTAVLAAAGSLDSAENIVSKAIENSAQNKKCVIFTGAPGTGKTYCVEQYVDPKMQALRFDKSEYFVQFHSSYDYTDFMEGLRPVQKDGKMVFVRMDGIFKAFCRKVVALTEQKKQSGEKPGGQKQYYYFVIDEINRADLGRVFGELMYCFEKRKDGDKIATQYANLPAYGKDAISGEIVRIEKDHFYIKDESGDFVPVKDEHSGNSYYVKDKNGNFVPVEDGFHIKGEDGNFISVENDCFKGGFYIPDNVVIVGTMNDIDRSVETFDFALRRRFDWIGIDANRVMRRSLKNMVNVTDDVMDELVERITNMNDHIASATEYGLNSAFAIGPAYFKGYNGNNLLDIWEQNIRPILLEYMRGRQNATTFVGACETELFKTPKSSGAAASGSQQPAGKQ